MKYLQFTPERIREKNLVSFSGAEFEFKTARPVIDAVKEAAENGLFGFTVPDENYLSHIVWWMKEVRGTEILPEWILPVQGTIFSVATAIRMFTEKGQGVIIPVPGYNRYEQAAVRLGRRGVLSPMKERDGRLLPDPEDLERAMSAGDNPLLILCNPNNPTGQIMDEACLEEILALAKRYSTAILCDEIFADVVFEKRVPVLAALAGPEDPVISVISLGKTFSFTGVNHGNVIIKNDSLRERYRTQRNADHYGSIDPMVYAALCGGYSPEGKEWLEEMIQVIRRNNGIVTEFLAEHFPKVTVRKPEGTYVLWADFTGLGLSREELFDFLGKEALFSCDPGEEYYGKPCQVRICTAVPEKDLRNGLDLLLAAAAKRGLLL